MGVGKTLLIIFGFAVALVYAVGLIMQVFSEKVVSGREAFTINPIKVFVIAFSTPATFGLVLLAIVAIVAVVVLYNVSQKRIGKESTSDTLGSSRFMSDQEVKEVFTWGDIRKIDGPVLGKYKGRFLAVPTDKRPFEYSMPNKNIILFGVPGAGKTASTIIPMVIQAFKRNESVVVTDVKGDVYEATFTIAMKYGYKVLVFNTDNCSNSDGWNILASIGTDINLAQEMAHCILKNTLDAEAKSPEQYFEDGMYNLLVALILYVNHEAIVEKRDCEENGLEFDDNPFDGFGTIGRLYDILLGIIYSDSEIERKTDCNGKPVELTTYDKIASLFKNIAPEKGSSEIHPAYRTWQVFESTQAKNRDNFVASLATRLRTLQDREARIMLGKNDIDLTLPGKEKTIIYVNKPEGDSTHTMMTASFFSMMFFSLTKVAGRSSGRKLPIHVNMVLDEFANIGKIPNFERKPATVRSQGISLVISVQTLSQLKRMYPDEEWVSIKAMCAISMLLAAGDDNVTTEEFAKSVGKTTVKTEQTRVQRSTFAFFEMIPTYTEGVGEQQTDLMKADEIRRMRLDQTLVITKFKPIIINKFMYNELPEAQYSIKVNINEHKANLENYAHMATENVSKVKSNYVPVANGEIGYYRREDLDAQERDNGENALDDLMSEDFSEDNNYICSYVDEKDKPTPETVKKDPSYDPDPNDDGDECTVNFKNFKNFPTSM